MPYFTLGYPTPEMSLDVVEAIAGAGADLIELGVPFSDPLADGPTIQHSTQVALEQGVNAAQCLEMVADLRSRGVAQPLMLMGYLWLPFKDCMHYPKSMLIRYRICREKMKHCVTS